MSKPKNPFKEQYYCAATKDEGCDHKHKYFNTANKCVMKLNKFYLGAPFKVHSVHFEVYTYED